MGNFLKRIFGRTKTEKPSKSASETILDADDPRIGEGYRRIDRYWHEVGEPDANLISYMINPQFQGKPAWPNTRQAYRVIRRPGSVIISSDGLSDPFAGTNILDANGFGCEVFIETPDFVGAKFDALKQSWAFALIENFAMNVADWGGIVPRLEDHGVLSLEIPMHDVLPADWLNDQGAAGLLIGVPLSGRSEKIEMPFGPVRFIPITLLHPKELAAVVKGGRDGRADIAEKLKSSGNGHFSTVTRTSTV